MLMVNDIWKWFDGKFKVHCREYDQARQILGWNGAEEGGIYQFPDGHVEMDVLIPGRLYDRVAKLLKLPNKAKSPGRVVVGKQKAETNSRHRFLRRSFSEICPYRQEPEQG
ncbi:MAG: hypothetical protein AB1690_03625 [Candidatus Zixiibacteriota bacterium]